MLPGDIRLYTWVDVEDILLRIQKRGDWPEWLVWARPYWDGLTLGIQKRSTNTAKKWLEKEFEPRFDGNSLSILLESTNGRSRPFHVFFEETDETPPPPRLIPTLARPSVVLKPSEQDFPPPLSPDFPPVIAFHSFKGGVGRTLHSLAFAQVLSQNNGRHSRVLLIDGDLEAPGLTWLLYSRIPNPEISFVDLLALVHSDPNPEALESIELASMKIKDMLLDGIYVLPAFRAISQFSTLEIKPEHLINSAEDSFIITKILAELGKKIGASAVIVDLRAGLSELSAGLLLDPRVYRIIVTSLSAQSIEGTCELMKILREFKIPGNSNYPPSSIILSQVTENAKIGDFIPQMEEKIIEAAIAQEVEQEGEQPEPIILDTPFNQNLFVLSDKWDKVMRDIQRSGIGEILGQLKDWLPGDIPGTDSRIEEITPSQLQKHRKKLKEFSNDLIFAETSNIEKFLTISPLRNLASNFRNKVPIAVVVGAKGAGKTYTYLQIARRSTWRKFVEDAVKMEVSVDAGVCPVLYSTNIGEQARKIINSKRSETIKKLGLTRDDGYEKTLDYLRDNLKNEDLHEGQWRECWLDVIAWNCGFEVGKKNVGRSYNEYLNKKNLFVVAVIDGLEDLFQNLSTRDNEQTALRSLLQDVPEWLEQQPARRIGLIIFVRQDMVINAVKQNHAQLMAKYGAYTLKWDSVEALRLVAWIAMESGVLESPKEKDIQEMEKGALVNLLTRVWGRKLGKEDSNEARSAEWVISVLSDLNGQIQARDIVRLLNKAADDSITDSYWKERILVPKAIRNSVGLCSDEKIKEISLENPSLGTILKKLKDETDEEKKRIPFTREDVNLDSVEIGTLENNGVILKEKEAFYMPEIFRQGLDFKLKRGARPRVLSLSRRARK